MMKPFLGIDITEDKHNETMNGDELLVAKPSEGLTQTLENASEDVEETLEKSKLPLLLRIGQGVCGVVGAMIAIGIVRALVDEDAVTLEQAYNNAPWLFWAGGICLVVWFFLWWLGHRKEKAVLETEESEQVFSDLTTSADAVFAELGVPSDAKETDLLMFFYKVKNDKIKPCEKGLMPTPYITMIFRAFADAENLYFANLGGKYALPLSSIKAIKTVKKTICTDVWNKEEPHNKGDYKQYKLAETNFGGISCRYYHIMEVEHNGELWGVYIPSYELPIIEELTGLTAEY